MRTEVIFVTGAGSGIGRAVAERLAADRHNVLAADLNAEPARATAEAAGPLVSAARIDVTDERSVRTVVAGAAERDRDRLWLVPRETGSSFAV